MNPFATAALLAIAIAQLSMAYMAIQHYLGHKNIQHTVRYTELAPDRFNGFWKD